MKNLVPILLFCFISCHNSEMDLIGTWKITKVENSEGTKIDSTNFLGETIVYHENGNVDHNNPRSPVEEFRKQSGKWEIKNDTLFQFNKGEKKSPFHIAKLNDRELIITQKSGKIETTIHYTKAK